MVVGSKSKEEKKSATVEKKKKIDMKESHENISL